MIPVSGSTMRGFGFGFGATEVGEGAAVVVDDDGAALAVVGVGVGVALGFPSLVQAESRRVPQLARTMVVRRARITGDHPRRPTMWDSGSRIAPLYGGTVTPTRFERYLDHLDRLSGGREPEFWRVESSTPEGEGVAAIGYRNLPEEGLFLGLTYGLSLARQEVWTLGRPELSICVRSDDPVWALAIAFLAEQLREACPFSYGNTISFGEQIAEGSALDGFLVFAPITVDPDDADIDVGDDLPIRIAGMYPTYQSERDYIAAEGVEAFWKLEWDPYDVGRPPAV